LPQASAALCYDEGWAFGYDGENKESDWTMKANGTKLWIERGFACLAVMVILTGARPVALSAANPASSAGQDAAAAKKLRLLVVAGGHGYKVPQFRAIFDKYPDIECTFVDEKQGGEAFEDIGKWPYDAVLLYNYMKKPSDKQFANFLALTDRGVGLVILHHAIYGYRPRPEFQKIVGVTSWLSGSHAFVTMKMHVKDPKHPITKGLADFTIHDETYNGAKLDPSDHVLLTTDEPQNAKAVAWVHTYRKSPVCYFQLGHAESAYSNPGFVAFLGRAIHWAAGIAKADACVSVLSNRDIPSTAIAASSHSKRCSPTDDPIETCSARRSSQISSRLPLAKSVSMNAHRRLINGEAIGLFSISILSALRRLELRFLAASAADSSMSRN
jgi:type 1 glutamine amidotransferase